MMNLAMCDIIFPQKCGRVRVRGSEDCSESVIFTKEVSYLCTHETHEAGRYWLLGVVPVY